jgi:hypothetical protein
MLHQIPCFEPTRIRIVVQVAMDMRDAPFLQEIK